MKYIFILPVVFAIAGGFLIYRTEKAMDYLRDKTDWCYERGGTMIETQCVKLERLDTINL